ARSIEIVEYLLNHGAEVNCPNGEIGSALYLASSEGALGIVQQLLDRKADPNLLGGRQVTALAAAVDRVSLDVVQLLVENGAELNPSHIGDWGGALYRAIESEALDCVNTLLEYCVDVNQKGGALHTPLQMAAYQGDVEPVERFCNHSADINAVGGKYHTALQAAVAGDNIETARWLPNAGADPNENGGEYGSALHAAIHAEDPIPLIDLLLEHKADINAVGE
ncbi:ankyrin repeat domain-containing protein, partial [Aspergillus glaucus CBS 516.65]